MQLGTFQHKIYQNPLRHLLSSLLYLEPPLLFAWIFLQGPKLYPECPQNVYSQLTGKEETWPDSFLATMTDSSFLKCMISSTIHIPEPFWLAALRYLPHCKLAYSLVRHAKFSHAFNTKGNRPEIVSVCPLATSSTRAKLGTGKLFSCKKTFCLYLF